MLRRLGTQRAHDQLDPLGLYGYQFAQAAELIRDYEGWAEEDFVAFKRWMLDVWYPQCIGFLRRRRVWRTCHESTTTMAPTACTIPTVAPG
ncbi:MAG: hypothetical protein J6V12_05095 [Bacteroidaceae bacterium]|nr:hypothetical protein [Bacteroidaceae bacterium]